MDKKEQTQENAPNVVEQLQEYFNENVRGDKASEAAFLNSLNKLLEGIETE